MTELKINSKFYKRMNTENNSSLWAVSMLPGDRNGLPDDLFYSSYWRRL